MSKADRRGDARSVVLGLGVRKAHAKRKPECPECGARYIVHCQCRHSQPPPESS